MELPRHRRPCVPAALSRQPSWELPPGPAAAGWARRRVRSQLFAWDLPACADVAELLVSELVTNALRHGRQPVTLRMARCLGGLVVEVSDSGAGLPRARTADSDHESGRGLHLVEALAERWGVRRCPRRTAVWFRLACAPDHPTAGGVPVSAPHTEPSGGLWTIQAEVLACV
ncbi:MAG: ATP-binding protein [Streptomycetaceae bacterium]|nr:ATP-binding protein [Streptomycetaceae bacterium]